MAGWSTHSGVALVFRRDNVDTDQLIPARFMSQPRKDGYGDFLLHDLRRDSDGRADPGFPLNRHPETTVLLTGRNFGSGSSREAAVYALVDAGIRAVVGPGFGDIFASNAVNNGLLPARVSDAQADALADAIGDGTAKAAIDLEAGRIAIGRCDVAFELDDMWRTKLINGWDDIDLTLRHADAIRAYKTDRSTSAPWAWPAAEPQTGPA